MAFRVSRRAFLAGVGGTAVGLPFLEIMSGGRASADPATSPPRFLVAFMGSSLGTGSSLWVPGATALGPLADYGGVSSEITIVSGMKIPWDTGSGVPAGGRTVNFHSSTVSPLLSGTRSLEPAADCNGPTSDQIVAAQIGDGTRFRSLEYRVQAEAYRGGGSAKGRMSYGMDGSPRDPIASPRLAFDSLFTGFSAEDPEEAARRAALLEEDRSVLDLVRGRAERLMGKLGRADRVRLERHFDEIRALEMRIAMIPETTTGACRELPDPGADASVTRDAYGGDIEIGYANETQRARVMCDLIHMAFTCDLTRSVSLMFTFVQSFMNVNSIVGVTTDLHELGHGAGSAEDMASGIAWHVDHFAYLISRLRDTPEGDGNLLDRSALLLMAEGGNGFDPESGSDGRAHSSERMGCLIAGRAGGLRPGRHIVATDQHPAGVILAAMGAVGVDGPLGEVSRPVAEVF